MDLYVGNLPKGTRPAEIKKLIKESFRGHIFQGLYDRILHLGRFEKDMAIDIRNKRGRRGYRYGKIHFVSERMGLMALDILNGCRIRGAGLAVRPYVARTRDNDRRVDTLTANRWSGEERRKNKDRRRH